MSSWKLPPNRACHRCGANDVDVLQRSLPGTVLRYCRPCWAELVDAIRAWEYASLRARAS